MGYSVLEICSGGGGQALGLEMAGFSCAAAVEIDAHACQTLRLNRPDWRVMEGDIKFIRGRDFEGVDLLAGGVPCPPFSIAGKQLGEDDERDLFPQALRLVEEIRPAAVLLENVPGFASRKFSDYRNEVFRRLTSMGYLPDSRVLNASHFGVPQLRPRFVLVALRADLPGRFCWPNETSPTFTVSDAISDLMGMEDWPGLSQWIETANKIAPTVVGGSKRHGGPDLGPTRAKAAWRSLGVDGAGIANDPPGVDFPVEGLPRLTNRMVARIQGFPDHWEFSGRKTAAYRQIGNAFPPPVARAVACSILDSLSGRGSQKYWQTAEGQFHILETR